MATKLENRLEQIKQDIDQTKQDIEAARQEAAELVIEDKSTAAADKKVNELTNRLQTLEQAEQLAVQRIREAAEAEAEKTRLAGQKKIDKLEAEANKVFEQLCNVVMLTSELREQYKELYREARTVSQETGATFYKYRLTENLASSLDTAVVYFGRLGSK